MKVISLQELEGIRRTAAENGLERSERKESAKLVDDSKTTR